MITDEQVYSYLDVLDRGVAADGKEQVEARMQLLEEALAYFERATDKERKRALAKFLNLKQWQLGRGHVMTQNEFAVKLGVNDGALSQWMNERRIPNDESADALANALGNIVYDILGKPHKMPNDPDLNIVSKLWHLLPKDARKKYRDMIQDQAEEYMDKAHNPDGYAGTVKA